MKIITYIYYICVHGVPERRMQPDCDRHTAFGFLVNELSGATLTYGAFICHTQCTNHSNIQWWQSQIDCGGRVFLASLRTASTVMCYIQNCSIHNNFLSMKWLAGPMKFPKFSHNKSQIGSRVFLRMGSLKNGEHRRLNRLHWNAHCWTHCRQADMPRSRFDA